MSITRRDFLKTSLGAATIASVVPPALRCRAVAADGSRHDDETILVVVQLAGGNDGLNTIVPYADDHYARNRRTLRLTAGEVLKIDSFLGFHPAMAAFERLFKEGLLTVVQGVGYPHPNQDHGTSMRIWQTGRPETPRHETGWLGSAADVLYRDGKTDVPAVFVGEIPRPFTLNAQCTIIPSIHRLDECILQPPLGPLAAKAIEPRRGGRHDSLLEFVRQTTVASHAFSRKIEMAIHRPTNSEYPPFSLAASLRTIAQAIRADAGIRVFGAELGGAEPGGFDNHANQRDNHASLLRQLSQSVAAFADDLHRDRLLERVLLVTCSEFGRTLAENGRRGTDHGSAAPLFLVGGGLHGGVLGPHPSLAETEGGGGVKHHTDFRRVYAALLERWLGIDSQRILGGRFELLEIERGARA